MFAFLSYSSDIWICFSHHLEANNQTLPALVTGTLHLATCWASPTLKNDGIFQQPLVRGRFLGAQFVWFLMCLFSRLGCDILQWLATFSSAGFSPNFLHVFLYQEKGNTQQTPEQCQQFHIILQNVDYIIWSAIGWNKLEIHSLWIIIKSSWLAKSWNSSQLDITSGYLIFFTQITKKPTPAGWNKNPISQSHQPISIHLTRSDPRNFWKGPVWPIRSVKIPSSPVALLRPSAFFASTKRRSTYVGSWRGMDGMGFGGGWYNHLQNKLVFVCLQVYIYIYTSRCKCTVQLYVYPIVYVYFENETS